MQKQFTKIMLFGFILFGLILTFIIFYRNPQQGSVTIALFYLSLIMAISCLFSLISFYIRKKISNNEIYFANIKVSFRQSFLFAVFVGLTLFLASIRLLTWWDMILLALSLTLLELYFESSKTKPRHSRGQTV
jgi:hypothetical protein